MDDVNLDLGDYMPYLGTVYRNPFKERAPDYTDSEVMKFLYDAGEDLAKYQAYKVTPRTLVGAKKAMLRYNRPPHPISPEVFELYKLASTWLDKEFGPVMGNSSVSSMDTIIE